MKMKHVLDNPIYQALIGKHRDFSEGNEEVRFYRKNIAAFAGMQTYNDAGFELLSQMSEAEDLFIVFSPDELQISPPWNLVKQIDMFQFIFEQQEIPKGNDDFVYTDLEDAHIQEMIDLVAFTQPGPFIERTIDLGNYTGVFMDGKLVAMAGHRFNPGEYIEISAVCTHPDYLGKGYAYALIREQIKRILSKSQTPFLHVRDDNAGAIKLYEKLGFKIRSRMKAYVLQKLP